jgi:ABC-type uncharacterized transport system ATPase subunit
VAEVTATYPVHDLMVEHPPIEETVAALYQQGAEEKADGAERGA